MPTVHVTAAGESVDVDYSTGFVRPSGPGYVRYEDLTQPGDTVSQAVNRLKTPAVITFPEGVFEFSDFKGAPGAPQAPVGIFLPHLCLGIIGSGPGVPGSTGTGTIFRVKANTSTVPKIPQDNKTPNSACMIYHGTGTTRGVPYLYGQFQLIGTPQQNCYHGLTIKNPAGPVTIFDVNTFGGYADSGAPPGETFMVGLSGGGDAHRVLRCHADGNNTGGGLTAETCLGVEFRDCTSRNTVTAPMVLYQTFNAKTFDCVLGPRGSNAATGAGQPVFNHERTSGTVHTRLKQVGVVPRTNVNVTHSNDTYTATYGGVAYTTVDGSLTLVDPDMPGAAGDGLINIQAWTPYGGGDTVKTAPVVQRSDGTRIPYHWIHGASVLVK